MRADRLITLLMLLQKNGRMTAQELAERLEVSTRTIYRDLDALSASGVPVYAERGPNGGCELLERYRTNLTGLKEGEVQALFMLTVPGLLADLGAEKDGENAYLKLTAALPAPFQSQAEQVQNRLHLDPAAWFQPREATPFLGVLQEAIWEGRRVRMTYRRGDGEWVKRLIDPLGLVAKGSIWYVVAQTKSPRPLVYRVGRMEEAALTDGRFARPEGFDLAQFWEAWCANFEARQTSLRVSLRVSAQVVPLLAQQFGEHIYRQLGNIDEAGVSELEMTFDSVETAVRQLLGFGSLIEVVAPLPLQKRLLETAQQVLNQYDDS